MSVLQPQQVINFIYEPEMSMIRSRIGAGFWPFLARSDQSRTGM